MQSFLATPSSVNPVAESAGELLRTAGHAAYTTARTNGDGHVFKLSQHLSRMSETVDILHSRGHLPFAADDALGASLREAGRRALAAFRTAAAGRVGQTEGVVSGSAGPPAKLTFLVTSGPDGTAFVRVHATALAARTAPAGGARCLVGGRPREDARAKDSEWVSQRASLEAEMDWSTEEVVLVSEAGALMEGTQTNFFAVLDGTVCTAEEGVLQGTVRALVLEVCAAEGIPVRRAPPTLADAPRFDGAFIASTSRLVMPVGELVLLPDAVDVMARVDPAAADRAAAAAADRPARERGDAVAASRHDARPVVPMPALSADAVVERIRAGVEARFDATCEAL